MAILRRAALSAAVLLAMLGVAGCGSSSSDTISAEDWASQFCTAVTTYTDSLSTAAKSLKSSGVSKSSLQTAASDVESSTTAFVSDVKALKDPDISEAQDAKKSVSTLSDQLDSDKSSVKQATSDVSGLSGLATAVSSVSATVASATSQVQSTVNDVKALGSDMKDAFAKADSCSSLRSS